MAEGVKSDADLMRLVRKRYHEAVDADRENRRRDAEDRKFYTGGTNQWPEGVPAERADDGRPCETFNRLPQFVKQVTGEIRQNKPAIKVLPNDGQTDIELANVYNDLIRHIESGSDAHRVYARETEKAVIGGCAWWRVKADYCGDSFDQDLYIEGIPNPNAVAVDPDAKDITRKDMMFAFVAELVSRAKFKATYKGVTETAFDTDDMADWREGDFIRIAEYWEKRETGKKKLYAIDTEQGTITAGEDEIRAEFQLDPKAKIEGLPLNIRGKREVPQYEVRSRIVCGAQPLTEWEVWPGKFIPLVRVVGEEVEAEDRVFRHGLIHHAKSDQVSYNYSRNAAIEHVGMQPKAPFVGTVKQFSEFKGIWEQANRRNFPFLPYTPDPLAPGAPQRVAPPTMPSAIYQEVQVAQEGMKASTGIYDAALGAKSNETSGIAIARREAQGDTVTYVFIDNMEAAITQTGRILVDLIPHYYDENRVIRVMGEDEQIEKFQKLAEMMPDGVSWADVSRGSYDVIVSTGPAFASRRAEAADRLLQLAQVFPALQTVAGDKVVGALDIPFAQEIAERLKMTLPPGIDEQVDAERQPAPPDPMQQAQMEFQVRSAKAEVEGKEADTQIKQVQAAQATGQIEALIQQQVAVQVQAALATLLGQPIQ